MLCLHQCIAEELCYFGGIYNNIDGLPLFYAAKSGSGWARMRGGK